MSLKYLVHLLLLTIVFSFLIFTLKSYFFVDVSHVEETYIEPEAHIEVREEKVTPLLSADQKQSIQQAVRDGEIGKPKILYQYVPKSFISEVGEYKDSLNTVFTSDSMSDLRNRDLLRVELHKTPGSVRGKMKNKTVKLFGVPELPEGEFLSVGVHELAHYIDLYVLKKKVFTDLSEFFYSISWEATKVMKPGQNVDDFVSGYAMTNKYEDFAESFSYYVLHNDDFLQRAQTSNALHKKYLFFQDRVFRSDIFQDASFGNDGEIKEYYWDVTKIGIDTKKLLQYLEK